ncbi:MAG: hypothetical protein RLZZ555_1201 [Pseudomonadota bacterium]|jgi:type IV pilus assembly protein PilE
MKAGKIFLRGVTLIELVIVVAIVAILVSVAWPSYQNYVRRAHRADAKAILLENAQFLERNFTETNRYDQRANGDPVVLPVIRSPRETGNAQLYEITVSANDNGNPRTSYKLQAIPVAGQMMAGDACGAFTLNHLGQKGVTGTGLSAAECWR